MPKSSSKFWDRFRFRSKDGAGLIADYRRHRHAVSGRARPGLHPEVRFWILFFLSLSFYFIASNIGSGWIYLIAASLITALTLGMTLPWLSLAAIDATQSLSRQYTAGESATVAISVKRKRGLPDWLPVQLVHVLYELDAEAAGRRARAPMLSESVEPRGKPLQWTTAPLRRGVHRPGNIILSTCFPLGLVWCKKRAAPPPAERITVYPATVPLDGFFCFKLKTSTASRGGGSRASAPTRQSIYTRGVREYVRGDSPRHVHWASTARTGKLMVREFEVEGFPTFDVMLSLSGPWTSVSQFELAVTTAASLLALGHRMGIGPELFLNTGAEDIERTLPPCTPGIEHQMEVLSRVEPLKGSDETRGPSAFAGSERALVVVLPAHAHSESINYGHCFIVEVDDFSIPAEHRQCCSADAGGAGRGPTATLKTLSDLRDL